MSTPNLGLYLPVGTDNVDLLTTYTSDMTKIDTAYGNVSQSAQSANTLAGQAKAQAQSASDASSANANALVTMGNRVNVLETNGNVITGVVTKASQATWLHIGNTRVKAKNGIKKLWVELEFDKGMSITQQMYYSLIFTTDIKPQTPQVYGLMLRALIGSSPVSIVYAPVKWDIDGTVTINLSGFGENVVTIYSGAYFELTDF